MNSIGKCYSILDLRDKIQVGSSLFLKYLPHYSHMKLPIHTTFLRLHLSNFKPPYRTYNKVIIIAKAKSLLSAFKSNSISRFPHSFSRITFSPSLKLNLHKFDKDNCTSLHHPSILFYILNYLSSILVCRHNEGK